MALRIIQRRSHIATSTALILASSCLALAADEEAKLLPDGPGKEVVGRVCFECHGAGNFRKVRLDRDAWSEQVADMADRGAKGTPAELEAVVEYLTQNFGKDSKINVNTAPLVEIKAILGISVKEAQALLDYREANGKFKAWQEVGRIPGVDAKKIEAKKDLMAF